MWYVLQVFTGQEKKLKELCEKQISGEILEEVFLPFRVEMKRYGGGWHKEKQLLFPGYLFMVTGQIDRLHLALGKIDAFTRLLGDQEKPTPLTEDEVTFLKECGGKEHVVEMSTGIIENDQVKIVAGPLIGKEALIRKIDRHKRTATIEVELFGRLVTATVGVEIVRKNE